MDQGRADAAAAKALEDFNIIKAGKGGATQERCFADRQAVQGGREVPHLAGCNAGYRRAALVAALAALGGEREQGPWSVHELD